MQVGDEVEIFGPENSIDKLAEIGGTIPYELSCAVSKRVPRVYRRSGEVVGASCCCASERTSTRRGAYDKTGRANVRRV